MRVVVIGASGLIGGRLTEALRARGDEVIAVGRREPDDSGYADARWTAAEGPLPKEIVGGAHAIVNLVGAPVLGKRWSDDYKREIRDSRVETTTAVAESFGWEGGPSVLVNASAVGYYGSSEDPVDETAPAGEGFLARVGEQWEQAARVAADRGARVVMLRTAVVLDPRGGALEPMERATRLFAGGPIAGGRQWFPWIHHQDATGLILTALDDASLTGPVNLVAPEVVRQRQFAKALGRALNRPAIVPTPGFALRVLYGDGAEFLTEGVNAEPAVARAAGYDFVHPTLDGALREIYPG